jgi:hypothetical protein
VRRGKKVTLTPQKAHLNINIMYNKLLFQISYCTDEHITVRCVIVQRFLDFISAILCRTKNCDARYDFVKYGKNGTIENSANLIHEMSTKIFHF